MPGQGSIVENRDHNVHPSGPYSIIADRFEATLQEARHWNDIALDKLNGLNQLLASFDLPPGWQDIIRKVKVPSPTPVTVQPPDTLDNLQLDDNWPSVFPTFPGYKPLPDININTEKPIAPDAVNPTIRYNATPHSETLALKIFTTIYNDLENGGTGLSAEVEDAILTRNTIRNSRIDSKKYNDDMRAVGQTGYRFASGVVAELLLESSEQIHLKNREDSAALLYENFKLALDTKKFAITSGLEYDKIKRDFETTRDSLTVQADTAAAQLTVNLYLANIDKYKAEFIGLENEVRVALAKVDLAKSKTEFAFRAYENQLNSLGVKVDIKKAINDGKIQGYLGKVEAYKARQQANESYFKAVTYQKQIELESAKLELKKATEEVTNYVTSKLSYDTLRTEISKAISQLAQEASSGAWNAVNASATMGYSGNESINETWSHGDQLTEVHSSEHDTNRLF